MVSKAFGLPKNSKLLWQNFNEVIQNTADISANAGLIQNVELTGSIWFEAARLVK